MTKKVRLVLCIIVLIIIFFFMGKYLYENWQKVPFERLRFNFGWLIISYLIWGIAVIFMSILWKVILAYIGEKISFMQSLRIIVMSFLPKYIPGKVWEVAAQVWVTKKEAGVCAEKSGIGILLSTAMNIVSAMILVLIILPFGLRNKLSLHGHNLWTWLVPIIPILFIILYPAGFIKLINFGLRKIKRPEVKFIPKYTQLLTLLLIFILFWITQSVALYSFIRSFYLISPSFIVPLCGIHPLAWVIGFLSFITPAGLGVKEGVLAYFFSFFMPTSIGITASILIRIWATIGELGFFAIFARSIKIY